MNERILELLKSQKGYCSGEAISQTLRISRTAVWKHIQQLRQGGYNIKAVSHRGYSLIGTPDKLFPLEIKNHLNTKKFGRKIFYSDTVDSTMDVARRLALEGAREGVLICCEAQTKGRGRLGRKWISEKGKGVYASVILRPRIAVADAPQLTLLFAVSICQALRQETGLNAVIKWPNDIFVHHKKIAGILTELNAELDDIHFLIVGFGINVSQQIGESLPLATSVYQETQKHFSRVAILQEVLKSAEQDYFLFQREGFAPIAQKWRTCSATLGRRVNVMEKTGITQGRAIDIDANGALVIQTQDGKKVRKVSGDVVHLDSR